MTTHPNWPPSWAQLVEADELDRLSQPGTVPADRRGALEDYPHLELLKRLRTGEQRTRKDQS